VLLLAQNSARALFRATKHRPPELLLFPKIPTGI
jgi:hypothetical protein